MMKASASPTYPIHNNFDVLRLTMAFLVLLSHGAEIYGFSRDVWVFQQAELAVHGFFVISGFLISWSIDRSFSPKSYGIKRFCRIYPLYFVVITIQLCLLAYFNEGATPLGEALKYYISNLLTLNFLQLTFGTMLDSVNGNILAINGSLWTIKIELMFYAAMPVYIWLLKKWGVPFLIASFVCAFIYRFGLIDIIGIRFARQLPGAMAFFIAGSAMYFYAHHLHPRHSGEGRNPSLLLRQTLDGFWIKAGMTLGLAATTLITLSLISQPLAEEFLTLTLLAASIYLFAFHAPIIRLPLDISYGIYLWHVPTFLTMLHIYGNSIDALPLWLISIALVILLSILSALWIEQPAIRWAKNRTKK